MAGIGRRNGRGHIDIWPGWVDALSSLLMVVVFLLMVFVLAQFYLSTALQGRDQALAQLNARVAELAQQLALEQETGQALRTDIAALTEQLRASLVTRDRLQAELATLGQERDALATRAATADEGLETERRLTSEAQAQVALLNQQLAALRQQMAQIQAALEASEKLAAERQVQIADLGRRLNSALAGKVAELIRSRSEFFGRLREVLGDRPDIRIVGDRFIFQSEVLFDSASAELGPGGQIQLTQLAQTLREVSANFPKDLNWILRIDGHTDRLPIKSTRFPSNWELSSARAIAVVQFLIGQGIAPERLVAAGFGEHQPLEPGATPDILARNRRIEIKLDSR